MILRKRLVAYFTVIAIVLIALILRLWQLNAVPFRGDEAFSAQYWSALPLSQSLTQIAPIEPHPPLTYALFRGWAILFGTDSTWLLRLLPTLFNLMGVTGLYVLGKRLSHSHSIGLLSALLWAIHPFEIWHAQDYRNYAVWAGLSTLTLYWGIRAIQTRQHTRIYALFALMTALIFYFELFLSVSLIGWGVITHWRKNRVFMWRWVWLNAFIGLSVASIFLILQGGLFARGGYGGNTASFHPDQWITVFLPVLAFGETFPSHQWATVGALLVIVYALAWGVITRDQLSVAGLIALLIAIPLGLLGLVSTRVSVFSPRYVLAIVPAFMLLIALGVNKWYQQKSRWRFVPITIIALVWGGLTAYSLSGHYTNSLFSKAPDWVGLRDYLVAQAHPEDYFLQSAVDPSLGYYLANLPNKAIPYHPQQSTEEIHAILDEIQQNHSAFWWVNTGNQNFPNAHVVPEWLQSNYVLGRELTVSGFYVQYWQPFTLSTEVQFTPATFGDIATLNAWQLIEEHPAPYHTLQLVWNPQATIPEDLKFTVQILDESGIVTAQQDAPFPNQKVPFLQAISLETGHLAGTQRVIVALYHASDGTRLRLQDGTDFIQIGTITPSTK